MIFPDGLNCTATGAGRDEAGASPPEHPMKPVRVDATTADKVSAVSRRW